MPEWCQHPRFRRRSVTLLLVLSKWHTLVSCFCLVQVLFLRILSLWIKCSWHISRMRTHFLTEKLCEIVPFRRWSRADWWLVYRFWGHLIWAPEFKKRRKRITNVLRKNKKLPSVTLFSKMNIESEHMNAISRTKNCHGTLIFLFPSILR